MKITEQEVRYVAALANLNKLVKENLTANAARLEPVLVAGLWGSSGQLATGPVAVFLLLIPGWAPFAQAPLAGSPKFQRYSSS